MNKKIFSTLLLSAFAIYGYSQSPLKLTIKKAIDLAQRNSLDYKIAMNTTRASYWNFQAYRSGFLPKLSLNGALPDYYRTINTILLPNGQNNFVSQNVDNSSL